MSNTFYKDHWMWSYALMCWVDMDEEAVQAKDLEIWFFLFQGRYNTDYK